MTYSYCSLEIIAKIVVYGFIIPHSSITSPRQKLEKSLSIPIGSSLLASALGQCICFCTFGYITQQPTKEAHPNRNSHIQLSPITPSSLSGNPFKSSGNMSDPISFKDPLSMAKHRPYLSNFGNWLDLISVICYWIDFTLMQVNYTEVSLFKALGAARPLRLVGIIPGTAVSHLRRHETGKSPK